MLDFGLENLIFYGSVSASVPKCSMYRRVNNIIDVYAFGVVLLGLISSRKSMDTSKPEGEENLVSNWVRFCEISRS